MRRGLCDTVSGVRTTTCDEDEPRRQDETTDDDDSDADQPLSSTCRMSACRFCCPNGDILCRVGDMSRHVSVMSPTRLDVVSARVSKTTRQSGDSRHVGNFVSVV